MAYAGQHFTNRLLAAMAGEKNVVACSFVENNLTKAPFFSTPVRLGPNGVEEVLHYGTVSPYEQDILDKMIPDLIAQAKKGTDFIAGNK
jgi:malate/lactate dehydrogenase